MANKRPLTTAAANANINHNAGKQTRFDISQIQPIVLKRSEILSHEVSRVYDIDIETGSDVTEVEEPLPSCLRAARRSWPVHPDSMTPVRQNEACSVQFRSNVTVKRIPSRHEYSPNTRRELWSGLQEIRENAMRNEAEFSYDGCNWRNCCEEEDMFFDKHSGSLIHPAHVETVCVYNGREWKPISKDETIHSTTPEPLTPPAPAMVCIVCDIGP